MTKLKYYALETKGFLPREVKSDSPPFGYTTAVAMLDASDANKNGISRIDGVGVREEVYNAVYYWLEPHADNR